MRGAGSSVLRAISERGDCLFDSFSILLTARRIVDREECQFQAVVHTDLIEDIGEVMFDRLKAYAEFLRDFLICPARNHLGDNLIFARCQTPRPLRHIRGGAARPPRQFPD